MPPTVGHIAVNAPYLARQDVGRGSIAAAGAVGILLGDQRGTLQLVAASTEQARLLELFQLQNDEGPCLECFSTGEAVTNGDLTDSAKWPLFGPEARRDGFQSVQAFPLRLRKAVIGTMNIFMADRVTYSEEDLSLCQALADVATIALLQNQAATQAQTVNGQLQRALDSRVAVEQAKGILAERAHIDVDGAFTLLRRFARDRNRQLSEVASALVAGTLTFDTSGRAPQDGREK